MIKFVIRWAFRLLILFLVLVVALLLLKDTIIKSVVEARIRAETGMEARIGKFELGLLSSTVTIEDFKLYNSAEFGGSPLIDLRELHLEMDGNRLPSRELHFRLIRVNLAEVNVVENKDGKTNLELLQELQKKKTSQQVDLTFTGIDTLNLTVGKLRFTKLKQSGQVREVNIGLQNEILTNVRSAADLTGLLVKLALKHGTNLFDTGVVSPGELLLKESGKAVGRGGEKLVDGLTAPFRK